MVAERYISDGGTQMVLVTQQMVDAGSVNRWNSRAPEYSIARKNSAGLVKIWRASLDCGPGLQQHQQRLAERQTAAMDSLTQLRQMRMQTR